MTARPGPDSARGGSLVFAPNPYRRAKARSRNGATPRNNEVPSNPDTYRHRRTVGDATHVMFLPFYGGCAPATKTSRRSTTPTSSRAPRRTRTTT
ncbi:hypothetical protein BGLA2_1590023 [Burkholderia gladioli]|nr:hypothetical protein BGLA2_1590023 [Burkholderia gladioli]